MSSIWSASSSTRYWVWDRSTAPRSIRSISRPGVAISTSTPVHAHDHIDRGATADARNCRIGVPDRIGVDILGRSVASSRVGTPISARQVFGSGLRPMFRNRQHRQAKGRRLACCPVWAKARVAATMPGMDFSWMGGGVDAHALQVDRHARVDARAGEGVSISGMARRMKDFSSGSARIRGGWSGWWACRCGSRVCPLFAARFALVAVLPLEVGLARTVRARSFVRHNFIHPCRPRIGAHGRGARIAAGSCEGGRYGLPASPPA